jgi:hypothetical protein
MGANAGIVAAESVAEMAVPIYVIGLDADAAQIERSGDFAAIERGRPTTMIYDGIVTSPSGLPSVNFGRNRQ